MAVHHCDWPQGVEVVDDGAGLLIDGESDSQSFRHESGDEPEAASIEDIACLLSKLDTPDTVASRMDSTRALDGTQTATWDGNTATWTYHPDNGLDIVISRD